MIGQIISVFSNAISQYFALSPVALTVLAIVAFGIVLLIMISIFDYLYGWFERKLMAKLQFRHGPTLVGKYGILQNLADIIKLLSKETIIPDNANKYLFLIGIPAMLSLFIFLIYLIPITSTIYGIDLSIGLLLLFALLSFSPLLVFITGWASGNKFASISSQRSVMMLISYEIPMLLVIAGIGVAAHSYDFLNIVNAQSTIPFAILMPIGFVIFSIAMLAELERPPFDIREADSELIAGWLTDVSSPYYAIALFIDYSRVLLGSLLLVVLFFSGWLGPSILPAFIWMAIKVLIVATALIFIRVSTVRMKINRLLNLGWMYMTPLAVINLLYIFALFNNVI